MWTAEVPPCPDPCCPEPDPCATCPQLWPARGPDWMITPNAGPCVANGIDAFITLEFLYWTAREDHLAFAIKQRVNMSGEVIAKGKVSKPNWTFAPGFKVGLGLMYNHDGWDIYANYTWLWTRKTKKTVDRSDNERLSYIAYFSKEAESITTNWKHQFNVVDLELGRNFFISRCLKLRPHFGLKGTWQKQKFNISGLRASDNQQALLFDRIRNKINYWGIGLRSGLDTSWHFTRSVSFLGEVAACVLWERFKSDYKSQEAPETSADLVTLTNLEDHFHTVKPVIELLLGLRWETWFCCDRYHFSAEGDWEMQWWGNQNQFLTDRFENAEGDLFFQGFTGKIRIDF